MKTTTKSISTFTDTKPFLWIEFIIVFYLLPFSILLMPPNVPKILILLVATVFVFVYLTKDKTFNNRNLLKFNAGNGFFKMLAVKTVVVSLVLFAITYFTNPTELFSFPRQRTGLWIMVMCLYPFLSAYPQEVIYRTFFFRRYEKIFITKRTLFWVSVISFSFLHVIYLNIIATLLTLAGGYLFASTYKKYDSVLAAGIEHAIYGCLIFTIGLGKNFFVLGKL